jgi:hypothetical protein
MAVTAQFDLLFKVQGSPEVANMQAQLKALGAATANAQAKFNGFGTSAANMNNAMANVNRGSGQLASRMQNAAFQVTDFVTQVQGGVSATRALSQQLPQLLGSMGALGAVIGAAAAVLLPFAANLTIVQENLDRIISYAGAAAAVLGGKFLLGLVAANGGFIALTKAVVTFSISLQALKGVLIATGFGALVVLLGEAIALFIRLKEQTGGWGKAAQVVFQAIMDSAGQLYELLMQLPAIGKAIWTAFAGYAQTAFSYVVTAWEAVVRSLGDAFSLLPDSLDLSQSLYSAADGAGQYAQSLANSAATAKKAWGDVGAIVSKAFTPTDAQRQIASAFFADYQGGLAAVKTQADSVGGSVKGISDKMTETKDKFKESWDAMAQNISDAKTPLMEFISSINEIASSIAENLASGLTNAFMSIIDGTKSAKEAFKAFAVDFLKQITAMILKATILYAIQSALGAVGGGGGIGGIFSKLLGGGASLYGTGGVGIAPVSAVATPTPFAGGSSASNVVGRIIPATENYSRQSGKSTPLNVTVINNSSAQVKTRKSADGGLTIEVVEEMVAAAMVRGGNKIDRAIQSGYGLRRAGR